MLIFVIVLFLIKKQAQGYYYSPHTIPFASNVHNTYSIVVKKSATMNVFHSMIYIYICLISFPRILIFHNKLLYSSLHILFHFSNRLSSSSLSYFNRIVLQITIPKNTGDFCITKISLYFQIALFHRMDIKEASSVKLDQLKGSGWVVMYPSYIDSSMSVKDGRKVRADLSCMLFNGNIRF